VTALTPDPSPDARERGDASRPGPGSAGGAPSPVRGSGIGVQICSGRELVLTTTSPCQPLPRGDEMDGTVVAWRWRAQARSGA
jgi:hypothetical protein